MATTFPFEDSDISELDVFIVSLKNHRYYMQRRFHKIHKKFCRLFEKKKSFVKYLDLPPKIRMMIVDQMRAKDICRFTRCSKQSRQEAKDSNNYIHSLEMIGFVEDRITIIIGHRKGKASIFLEFVKKNGKKWLEYAFKGKELWEKELDDSMSLFGHAAEHFKKLLGEYQNKIKLLGFQGDIIGPELKDYDFEIESLNNLEEMLLCGEMDVPLYFSKLQRPLKSLFIDGRNDRFLNECDQVYQIQNDVTIYETKMTNEQFQRLSAQSVFLDIGYLTEEDIYNFVRSWQNGSIGKEVKKYEWDDLQSSDFDLYKLFELFGTKFNLFEKENVIQIEHDKEEGKSAKLSYYSFSKCLNFKVIDKNRDDQSDML